MPRQNNIRWRENDLNELRRVVKNYNAKLSREREKLIREDKRYQASQLPPKASVRELRNTIGTRKDFNKSLGDMKNFIDTGYRFQVDANTKKSLRATVRDFNTKIDRLSRSAKTQGERAALPEKLKSSDLIKNASTKEALQRDIKDYKKFLKAGAEELVELPDTKNNIKLTRWQKETMDSRLAEINKARADELKKWQETEVRYGGKLAGYKQGQVRMDKGDFDELHPMKMYNYTSTYSGMRDKFKLMMRESQEGYWNARTELARINYTEKLKRIVGNDPRGKYLLKKINGLPLEDFKRVLKGDDDLYLLLYDLENFPDNYETILEEIWNEWEPEKDMYEELDNYIDRVGG